MLKDTFFTILSSENTESGRTCRIALNASHPIFQAHFAGNPIMPGACIVQMIKELTADYFDRTFFVCAVKNMKFLHAINPLESLEISVILSFAQQENNRISVSTVLSNADMVFVKSGLTLSSPTVLSPVNR